MSDSWQDGLEESRISAEDVQIEDEYRDPAREYSEGKHKSPFYSMVLDGQGSPIPSPILTV